MHNTASNCYETPPICLLVFWGAFLASNNREYQEKIAQLSICFVVLRFFYIFFMLSGLNLKFLPLRTLVWIASLATTFAAGGIGIAGAQEALKTTELAVACIDGVGCVCKTAGCIVGVIVGACVGFVFLVMLMSYIILSSTVSRQMLPAFSPIVFSSFDGAGGGIPTKMTQRGQHNSLSGGAGVERC